MKRKLLTCAYGAAPWLFCLAVYWPGVLAWFQQDDFAWLSLLNQVHTSHDLFRTIFEANPLQGSWRPLSERAFFLAFDAMFGSNSLPYRIWVFLTQFANLTLVACITMRLTRSRAAGFWAAILWVANSKLSTVMAWSSAYNQVLAAFFLLLALYFFIRYTESGAARFYVGAWIAFLTGFLAMEVNIIFPLLAGAYALLCARRYLARTLPFLAASGLYGIVHLTLAPNRAPEYRLHPGAMPATFWTYWQQTFEPIDLPYLSRSLRTFWPALMAVATVALLAFTIHQAKRRQWLPGVFLCWYVIALVPVLPLRDHISDYYLTIPTMCMAMLAAYALVYGWRSRGAVRVVSVLLVATFLAESVPAARRRVQYHRGVSEVQHTLVRSVVQERTLHPNKVILLAGVDDKLFSQFISQQPFRSLQIPDVYLAPGSEEHIAQHPQWGDLSNFILPASEARQGLERGDIMVYRVGRGPLSDITREYTVPSGSDGALRIDLADPLAEARLGPEWYGRESGYRWMPRTASLTIPAPRAPGQKVYATAICPAAQLEKGPLQMTLTVNGVRLAPVQFTIAGETTFAFALPLGARDQADLHISIELNRTVRVAGDSRDLGLAFLRFEIR